MYSDEITLTYDFFGGGGVILRKQISMERQKYISRFFSKFATKNISNQLLLGDFPEEPSDTSEGHRMWNLGRCSKEM